MHLYWTFVFLIGFIGSQVQCDKRMEKPNIFIILADDLGYNDVSIHGCDQIPTPNIDALGAFGITLKDLYVAPICTPSRSCLMTGKYESNTGMQHYVISNPSPYGLGLDEKTTAQYMNQAGYCTHLIGKWHLGFFEQEYTPLFRGFDSHFGYYGGFVDYINYTLGNGYDMRNNLAVDWDANGQYATELFTNEAIETIKRHDKSTPMFMILSHLAPHYPYQAPQEEIDKFSYIKDEQRRIYAAMVSKLDQSVGCVVKALEESCMLDNSIILFMSDNGAPTEGLYSNSGSNAPFKGQKDSPWEGAVRSAAAIFSPLFERCGRVSNQLMHVTDWLPTFAFVAGINIDNNIDGINMWNALSKDLPSPRKELLVHHDPEDPPFQAYISDMMMYGSKHRFKLVTGTTYNGTFDGWLSAEIDQSEQDENFGANYGAAVFESIAGQSLSKYSNIREENINKIRSNARITCNGHRPPEPNSMYACNPLISACLFDLSEDPCETKNLAKKYPNIVKKLQAKCDYYGRIAEPPRNAPPDPQANPGNFNGTWTWWIDVLYNGAAI